MPKPDDTYLFICELIENICSDAHEIRRERGEDVFKQNDGGKGYVERRFKLSTPEDVTSAVIELLFGQLEQEKENKKDFFLKDLPYLLKMHDLIKHEGYTQENAAAEFASKAHKKNKKSEDQSVVERLVKHYRIFCKLKAQAKAEQSPLNKFIKDQKTSYASEDFFINEIFIFRKWFLKYEQELKSFYKQKFNS